MLWHHVWPRLAVDAWLRHRGGAVLLNGHEQILPLCAVHYIWRQSVPSIEKLVPHLAEHVVAVQGLARDAYGVGRIANHYQKIREQLATSEIQRSPILRATIC